jgi:carbonic anhydrase/acetyltransferase-like protein (isoleucine patch superfamily)
MRSGSRLLSGASMEDGSMLSEHTLLPSGEIADADTVYAGWPAKSFKLLRDEKKSNTSSHLFICVKCREPPKDVMTTRCGHLFCER